MLMETQNAPRLGFKIIGVSPPDLGIRGLANLLIPLEETLEQLIGDRQEDLIGLVEIREGSVELGLVPRNCDVELAFLKTSHAISSGVYQGFSPNALKSLRKLKRVIKKKNYCVEMKIYKGEFNAEEVLATLSPDTLVPQKSTEEPVVTGETILYGRLDYLGGIRAYTAYVTTNQGHVRCQLTEENAKLARSRLFTVVGLRGTATWTLPGFRLLALQVEEILDYQERPIGAVFQEMSDAYGHHFEQINDVNAWIREMRESE